MHVDKMATSSSEKVVLSRIKILWTFDTSAVEIYFYSLLSNMRVWLLRVFISSEFVIHIATLAKKLCFPWELACEVLLIEMSASIYLAQIQFAAKGMILMSCGFAFLSKAGETTQF